MSECKEAVRLPSIINMELEANKLNQVTYKPVGVIIVKILEHGSTHFLLVLRICVSFFLSRIQQKI
jgi:hypothetical protein